MLVAVAPVTATVVPGAWVFRAFVMYVCTALLAPTPLASVTELKSNVTQAALSGRATTLTNRAAMNTRHAVPRSETIMRSSGRHHCKTNASTVTNQDRRNRCQFLRLFGRNVSSVA